MEPCALAAALGLGGCAPPVDCAAEPPAPGALTSCAAVEDRPYDVVLPEGAGPHPVLLVLHGGGGRPSGARKVTCLDGDLDDPGCIDRVATAAGMIVVFPAGVKGGLGTRTWNAGGGVDGWQCVSGKACEEGSDDGAVRHFDCHTDGGGFGIGLGGEPGGQFAKASVGVREGVLQRFASGPHKADLVSRHRPVDAGPGGEGIGDHGESSGMRMAGHRDAKSGPILALEARHRRGRPHHGSRLPGHLS